VSNRPRKDRGKPWWNSALFALLFLISVSSLYWSISREPTIYPLRYGEFIQVLEASRVDPRVVVQKVRVGHTDIRGEVLTTDPASDGKDNTPVARVTPFRALRLGLENDTKLHDLLKQTVGPNYQGEEEESPLRGLYSVLLTLVLFVGFGVALLFILRWMTGGGSPLSFGRSKAKMLTQKDLEATFKDVAGLDEAVAELREVVDFLKTPEKYQALGGRIPKGVLLVGPPGTGKTLIARAVAGEAQVPFFHLSGSDFVEMFVGVGAARVRDLFAQAERQAPCIIFIDELDALGKTRSGANFGGHDEREQTLNQLLVEMDGFESNRGVIIMAATNRPETLDAALLRPGRFDRTVVVDRPDLTGREAILRVHIRNVKLGPDVDLRRVAALTPGAVGADLENLVNEAALMAARAGKTAVGMADFNEAIERAAVGLERKSRIMLPEEKRRVAVHEAGHALVSCSLPNTDPVHKISIIPRGVGTLGYVLSRPDDDRMLATQSEIESRIKVALGGTLAEEMIYREVSNGATSDLERCTALARRMVKQFGMSRLGRISYQEQVGPGFLGVYGEVERPYSEETAREIDLEVKKIIDDATEEVRTILLTRRATLEALAQRLIEKEVIDGSELREMLEEMTPGPRLVPASDALPTQVPAPDERISGETVEQ
jgi:cell division protease FtsH